MRLKWLIESVISAAVILSATDHASAKDLGRLVRYLAPGYIAQDLNALCSAKIPSFSIGNLSGFGSVSLYAHHLKSEILTGLTQREALDVMVASAASALVSIRKEVPDLTGNIEGALASLNQWCNGSAKLFIVKAVRRHVTEHAAFEAAMMSSKK